MFQIIILHKYKIPINLNRFSNSLPKLLRCIRKLLDTLAPNTYKQQCITVIKGYVDLDFRYILYIKRFNRTKYVLESRNNSFHAIEFQDCYNKQSGFINEDKI